MGTLKTTNIQTITGSGTLTLGTTGETVALGSGATASGFGALVKVSEASGTALSSQGSIEVALPETYIAFKMYLDIKPETDAVHLQATLSVDDGSSYYTLTDLVTQIIHVLPDRSATSSSQSFQSANHSGHSFPSQIVSEWILLCVYSTVTGHWWKGDWW